MEKVISSFDDTKLYYVHKKNINPHTLVFLHGIGANWTVWRDEIDFFDKKGYSLLAPDLRGHGLSECPHDDEKYNITHFVKDLKHILKAEGIDNFTLIGHSLGGAIAIVYCGEYDRMPKSMVLLDTAHRYPFQQDREFNLSPVIVKFLRFLAKHDNLRENHFPHLSDGKNLKKFRNNHHILFQLLYHTPLKSIFKCLETIHDYAEKNIKEIEQTLHSLDMPVLIMTGFKDGIIDYKYSLELHKLINKSKLKVFRNAHHLIQIEKPREVNRNISNFLKAYNI